MKLMTSKKDVIFNVALFAAIIIGFVVIMAVTATPTPKTLSFETLDQIPIVRLSDGPGPKTTTLKEFRGHPLLINFWASWCKGCEAEREGLEKLAQVHLGKAVKMIAIASTDTQDAVNKSGGLKDSHLTHYLDESGNLALALDVKTLPQTLLIDSQGRIVTHFKKTLDAEQLAILSQQLDVLNGAVGVLGEVPPFKLQNTLGQPVNKNTLDKKTWVVNFIYTSCPMQCPLLTARMKELQDQFKGNDNFRLVSVTVDPKTDTPQVLKAYQEKFKADPKIWYFLTGGFGNIKHLIGGGFKLGTPENPELHTSKFVLVDGSQQIRGYYDTDSPEALKKLKSDITRLLSQNH